MINLPLAHLEAKLILDGKTYEIEQFRIGFSQPIDFKGQPQHEIGGGQMLIKLPHAADSGLYLWAKKSTLLKDGGILFQTDIGMTILEISFTNAYCISLTRELSAYNGTSTTLILSPEDVKMNGIEHNNFWSKK